MISYSLGLNLTNAFWFPLWSVSRRSAHFLSTRHHSCENQPFFAHQDWRPMELVLSVRIRMRWVWMTNHLLTKFNNVTSLWAASCVLTVTVTKIKVIINDLINFASHAVHTFSREMSSVHKKFTTCKLIIILSAWCHHLIGGKPVQITLVCMGPTGSELCHYQLYSWYVLISRTDYFWLSAPIKTHLTFFFLSVQEVKIDDFFSLTDQLSVCSLQPPQLLVNSKCILLLSVLVVCLCYGLFVSAAFWIRSIILWVYSGQVWLCLVPFWFFENQ